MTITSTESKYFKQNFDHNPINFPPYKENFCGNISVGKKEPKKKQKDKVLESKHQDLFDELFGDK